MHRLVLRSADDKHLSAFVGRAVAAMRRDVRLTQRQLGRRVGRSQAFVSMAEHARRSTISIEEAADLIRAMGGRLTLSIDGPLLAGGGPRDPAHARCIAAVEIALRRSGWATASEVEIGADRSQGWIDLVAWHAAPAVVLVIEIKTELRDLGDIQRTMAWYEREAWSIARRSGWQPRAVRGLVLALHTSTVDKQVADYRDALRIGFPARARDVQALVEGGRIFAGRAIGLVDPRSRRANWVRPTRLDGRRSPAPYNDYADFIRAARIADRDAGLDRRARPHGRKA